MKHIIQSNKFNNNNNINENNNNSINKHKRNYTTNSNMLNCYKTNTNFNSTIKSFYSTQLMNNYLLESDSKNQRPLNALYHSTFFPRSYKKKVYNKKYNTSLPMLTSNTNFFPIQNKNFNEEFIKDNINYYKKLYNKTNEQTSSYEIENESLFSILDKNKITKEESEFINKFSNKNVIKNSFGLNIICENKKYLNPKQSLQSLKII